MTTPRKRRKQGLSRLPRIAPTRYRAGFPWHGLDFRSTDGRFLGQFIGDVVADLGGEDALSRAQVTLIERASYYALKVAQYETADLVPGSEPCPNWTPGDHNAAVERLRRILLDLGLRRRAREVLPVLREYLAAAPQRHAEPSADAAPEREP